jgi:hypothetical protein
VGLVYCSDGKYDSGGSCMSHNTVTRPTINIIYFPNTLPWLFWSSSIFDFNGEQVEGVYYSGGVWNFTSKGTKGYIRLVQDVVSTSTSKLNDTGITTCSNETQNNLPCPVSDFPNQDAQSGRDATNNDDSDGHAGFSFTKINSTGASLPASATSWNCVKDNVTGLIWEVKTTDGGLHDKTNTYSWYEPDKTKNGGGAGTQNGGICKGSECDTNSYVLAVNTTGYCGYKDWRMPTREELMSIADLGIINLTIDVNYFSDTLTFGTIFWTSSPYVDTNTAYKVTTNTMYAQTIERGSSMPISTYKKCNIRLVR